MFSIKSEGQKQEADCEMQVHKAECRNVFAMVDVY